MPDYETREIRVEKRYAVSYAEGYASFGWDCKTEVKDPSDGAALLHLKRDRGLQKDVDLTKLQQQFEMEMASLARLEYAPKDWATAAALLLGITLGLLAMWGTAVAAGQHFAKWMIGLVIVMLVVSLSGYGIYRLVYHWKEKATEPRMIAARSRIQQLTVAGSKQLLIHSASDAG